MSPGEANALRQELSASGGAHVHDITQVAGNLFQLFLNSPAGLRDRIRIHEFRTLIAERVLTFVGCEFARQAVKDLLGSPSFPSGYILIRGEPGIGKTSLICALANEGGYLHHFNIALQNIRSSQDFLTNICGQLIVRYGLDYTVLPSTTTQNSAVFSRLLAEASDKATEPIVILVDALDEADDDTSVANCLFLPPTLPVGVYIVASSREQTDYRLAVDRRKDIFLREGANALAALIPQLGKHGHGDEAFMRYLGLPNWAKGSAIEHLAPYLSTEQLELAINEVSHIDDTHQAGARILSSLGPQLPGQLVGLGFGAALRLSNKFHRRDPLRIMVARLLQCPRQQRLQALDRALVAASDRNRLDFLYDIGSLAPLIADLGGVEPVRAIDYSRSRLHALVAIRRETAGSIIFRPLRRVS
jgi:hypothetical protein